MGKRRLPKRRYTRLYASNVRYDIFVRQHNSGVRETRFWIPGTYARMCIRSSIALLQLAWVAFRALLDLMHSAAALAGGLLAVMVPTQAHQIIIGVRPAGNDVVNVRCFFWATATHRIFPYVPATIAVSLQDLIPNLVPIAWQGSASARGRSLSQRVLPYSTATHRRHPRSSARNTAHTIVQMIQKYRVMAGFFHPGCRNLFPGL